MNSAVRGALEMNAVQDRIQDYRSEWRQHLDPMEEMRLPKTVLIYCPVGRRDLDSPRKIFFPVFFSWNCLLDYPVVMTGSNHFCMYIHRNV
jgi:hypothetical protein